MYCIKHAVEHGAFPCPLCWDAKEQASDPDYRDRLDRMVAAISCLPELNGSPWSRVVAFAMEAIDEINKALAERGDDE